MMDERHSLRLIAATYAGVRYLSYLYNSEANGDARVVTGVPNTVSQHGEAAARLIAGVRYQLNCFVSRIALFG